MDIINKIKELKKAKNAVILAHCYQNIEIDEVADFVGDSLYLSKMAAQTEADMIIFAGVYFMAQSAKLLSPKKRVFLPVMSAGCAMADMINKEKLEAFKAQYPNVPVVCYINSTAEVKALCDVCCTSSNAVDIVKSLKSDKVLFVPDYHLGKYIESKLDNVEVIGFDGCCPIHQKITLDFVLKARKNYPNAFIMAHPECNKQVAQACDFVGSTKQIMEYVMKSDKKQFVIATEKGVVDRLKRDCKKINSDKEFILIDNSIICPDMKKDTLEDILHVLEHENNEIFLDDDIAQRARKCIDKMFELSK